MIDISGYGTQINLIASNTFPLGINLTEFADDADPVDFPSIQIADAVMGLNGDLLTFSKASPIKVTLNMIPSGLDDELLAILLEANRVGKGKIGSRDIITLTILYPGLASGQLSKFVTLRRGLMTDGMPGNSISSGSRLKTKPYSFSFENKIGIGT